MTSAWQGGQVSLEAASFDVDRSSLVRLLGFTNMLDYLKDMKSLIYGGFKLLDFFLQAVIL